MTYRDDREALHHRVAQLEDELKDARREGQEEGRDEAEKRTAALQGKIGEMRGELERMELELQAMKGEQPKTRAQLPKPLLAMAGGIVALVGLGAVWAAARKSPPQPVIVLPPTMTLGKTAAPPTIEPAAPVVPPTVATATPKAPTRTTTARWNAQVAKADGLAVGGACTIDATIVTSDATNAILTDFKVTCGGKKIYDRADKLEGMAQMDNDAREVLGPSDDKSTFTLSYRDIGTRSGERAQVDLDTNHKQGSVWRDTIPRFRVELTIPKESVPGTPLTTASDRLKRTGKITEITGGAVKTGTTCTFRAMPIGKGKDCVAEVACGAAILWPTSAPVNCTYEGSKPATVEATADDAKLAIDGATLVVKTKSITSTIALDEK